MFQKITLLSADDEEIEVEQNTVKISPTFCDLVEEAREEQQKQTKSKKEFEIPPISLPNIKGVVLKAVISYCKLFTEQSINEVTTWGAKFLEENASILEELWNAARFFDIKPMLELLNNSSSMI